MFLGETQCSNINRGLRFPMLIIKEHNSIYIHSQLQSICCNATRTNRKITIAWTWRFSALLKLNRNVENVKPWDLYSLIISMARWILLCLLSLACTTLYWNDKTEVIPGRVGFSTPSVQAHFTFLILLQPTSHCSTAFTSSALTFNWPLPRHPVQ